MFGKKKLIKEIEGLHEEMWEMRHLVHFLLRESKFKVEPLNWVSIKELKNIVGRFQMNNIEKVIIKKIKK